MSDDDQKRGVSGGAAPPFVDAGWQQTMAQYTRLAERALGEHTSHVPVSARDLQFMCQLLGDYEQLSAMLRAGGVLASYCTPSSADDVDVAASYRVLAEAAEMVEKFLQPKGRELLYLVIDDGPRMLSSSPLAAQSVIEMLQQLLRLRAGELRGRPVEVTITEVPYCEGCAEEEDT